jgi:hypothetical protein
MKRADLTRRLRGALLVEPALAEWVREELRWRREPFEVLPAGATS